MEAVNSALFGWYKRMSLLLSFAGLAAVGLGALSSLLYWDNFGVDILLHLSVTDLIKHSAPWLVLTVPSSIAGSLLGHRLASSAGNESAEVSPFQLWRKRLSIYALILLAGAVVWVKWDELVLRYLFIAVPIFWLLAHFTDQIMSALRVRNTPTNRTLLVLAATLLVGAVVNALATAHELKDGRRFDALVALPIEAESRYMFPSGERSRPRLIGHVSDHVFAYRPDTETTVVLRLKDGEGYELKRVNPKWITLRP